MEAQEREFAVVAAAAAAAAAPHDATAEIEQALRLQSLERFIRRMNIKDRTASASRRARVEAARRRSVCGTGVAQRKSLGNATKEKLRRIMMMDAGAGGGGGGGGGKSGNGGGGGGDGDGGGGFSRRGDGGGERLVEEVIDGGQQRGKG